MAGRGSIQVAPLSINSGTYYLGLQPVDFQNTNFNFVSPGLTYNPATGTLNVGSIRYRNAGTTRNHQPRSAITYVDQAYTQSITQGVLTDVVPFSVSIIPSSAQSKIAIFVNWMGEHNTSANWDALYGLKRNGGEIGPPLNVGNRTGGMVMSANSYYTASADNNSTPEAFSLCYLDSPQTTSAVTYQLTVKSGTAAIALYTNRTVGDVLQASDYERGTSSIIAIEVA
jgi:hypothetical protein